MIWLNPQFRKAADSSALKPAALSRAGTIASKLAASSSKRVRMRRKCFSWKNKGSIRLRLR